MGRRGPRPEPTALRVLKGSPSHHAPNRREPKPRPGVPERPDWLDPEAAEQWDKTIPMLDRLGLLTEADGQALAAYCQAVALLRRCTIILREKGLTVTAGTGYEQQRPEANLMIKAMQAVRQFSAEFGLTPSARSRIEVPEQPEMELPAGGIR